MAAPPIPRDPTTAEALTLFKEVEEKFPAAALGSEKWYLVTLAALVGGNQPSHAETLYTHLISTPLYSTPSSRQALMRRLRETLVKLVSIIGVCKPLEAIFDIEAVVKEEDRDYSCSRENWQCDEENLKRGVGWLSRIYQQNREKTEDMFRSQRDFGWISRNITYGLYLSDHTILSDVETELVVLSGIMIQNLPRETAWHLRGSRRIGIERKDLEEVVGCIELVAKFCSVSLHKVPKVADIEHEV